MPYQRPKRDPETVRPCKLCKRPMRYMRVKKRVGKTEDFGWGGTMPVDTDILWGDGNMTLVVTHPPELAHRVIVKAGPEIQGVQSHFGTCPVYLNQQKRKQKK